jgi:hypothetical protein
MGSGASRSVESGVRKIILRKIGVVIAGILMVGGMVLTMRAISTRLCPLPEGLDPRDPDQADAFARYLPGMPATSWALTDGSRRSLGSYSGQGSARIPRVRSARAHTKGSPPLLRRAAFLLRSCDYSDGCIALLVVAYRTSSDGIIPVLCG